MKNLSLILFGWLLISSASYSFEKTINLSKAISLAENKSYEKSLRILAPCLKARPDKIENLEDCLFYGEVIATEAMRQPPFVSYKNETTLRSRYEREIDLSRTHGSFNSWISTLGISVTLDPNSFGDGEPEYSHNYIKTLIHLFPNSGHKDIYDYVVIERGENSMPPVQKWIEKLIAYRKNYPLGHYIFNATNDLANIYDNLWDILTPTTEFSGYYFHNGYFTSGNKGADMKNAIKYRSQALKLYKYLIEDGVPKDKYEESLLKEATIRFKDLTNKKRSNAFYIIND